jgi:probable addiction module antidote protein
MKPQRDDSKPIACQLEYLNAVLAEGDRATLVAALAAVARAQGMSRVVEDAGLGRLSLYKILSGNGNPTFATVAGVATELGYPISLSSMSKSLVVSSSTS